MQKTTTTTTHRMSVSLQAEKHICSRLRHGQTTPSPQRAKNLSLKTQADLISDTL